MARIGNNDPTKDINKYNFLRFQKPVLIPETSNLEYFNDLSVWAANDKGLLLPKDCTSDLIPVPDDEYIVNVNFAIWAVIGGINYRAPYGFDVGGVDMVNGDECYQSTCNYIQEEIINNVHYVKMHRKNNGPRLYLTHSQSSYYDFVQGEKVRIRIKNVTFQDTYFGLEIRFCGITHSFTPEQTFYEEITYEGDWNNGDLKIDAFSSLGEKWMRIGSITYERIEGSSNNKIEKVYTKIKLTKNDEAGKVSFKVNVPNLKNGPVTLTLHDVTFSREYVDLLIKFGTIEQSVSINQTFYGALEIVGNTDAAFIEIGIEFMEQYASEYTMEIDNISVVQNYVEPLPDIPTIVQPLSLNKIENAYNKIIAQAYLCMIPGDVISFFINRSLGLTPSLTNIRLIDQLLNKTVLTYTKGNVGGYLYFQFTCPSLNPGIYHIAVGEYDQEILLISNPILVISSDQERETLKLKYRNDFNHYGYQYEADEDFYNQIRIFGTMTENQPESETTVYQSTTTAKRREYNNRMSLVRTFETYYLDKDGHDAAFIFVNSSEKYINGIKHSLKEGYKIKQDLNSNTQKGEFKLYEEDFSINQ